MTCERVDSDFSRFCHDRSSIVRIGQGNDSTVYKLGNEVAKVYNVTLIPKSEMSAVLTYYKELTNIASALAEKENWQIEFPKSNKSLNLRVNSYTSLEQCPKHGVFVGRCPYIEGSNIHASSNFFSEDSMYEVICNANRFLIERIKEKGIDLKAVNIKKYSFNTFIITDLCSLISDIKL